MLDLATDCRELALAAAGGAAAAAAELIRFAREGQLSDQFAVEPETIEQLADALKTLIDVEWPFATRRNDMMEELGQLSAALSRFIEGWAG